MIKVLRDNKPLLEALTNAWMKENPEYLKTALPGEKIITKWALDLKRKLMDRIQYGTLSFVIDGIEKEGFIINLQGRVSEAETSRIGNPVMVKYENFTKNIDKDSGIQGKH